MPSGPSSIRVLWSRFGWALIPLALLAFWLVAGAAYLLITLPLPLPLCGLRRLTGWPCPFCGGTRTLAALAFLDFRSGFALNPLVALLWSGSILFLLLSLCFPLTRWTLASLGSLSRFKRSVWWLIASLLLLNWLYLCLRLPR